MIKGDPLWLAEFWKIIEAHSTKRFELGIHDCATVAQKVIRLTRPHASFPVWHDAAKALELTRNAGLIWEALNTLGGPIPPSRCQIGDVAIGYQDEPTAHFKYIAAVHDGTSFIVPNAIGFTKMPLSSALLGWNV